LDNLCKAEGGCHLLLLEGRLAGLMELSKDDLELIIAFFLLSNVLQHVVVHRPHGVCQSLAQSWVDIFELLLVELEDFGEERDDFFSEVLAQEPEELDLFFLLRLLHLVIDVRDKSNEHIHPFRVCDLFTHYLFDFFHGVLEGGVVAELGEGLVDGVLELIDVLGLLKEVPRRPRGRH